MAGVGGAPSSVAEADGEGEWPSWRQRQCRQCGDWGWHPPWHPEHKTKYCNKCVFLWKLWVEEKRRLEWQEWQWGQQSPASSQGQQWSHHTPASSQDQQWSHNFRGRDGNCLYGPLTTAHVSDEQKTNFEAWADAQPLAPGPQSPN